MKKILLVAAVLVLWLVPNLHATPLSIREIAVSGADMAGMLVTVEFADNTSETRIWQAGGGNLGFASGSGWTLQFDGSDTWFSNNLDDEADPFYTPTPDRLAYWEFTSSTPVSAFTIDAMAGLAVFDILAIWDEQGNLTGNPNSPGSFDGWWQENNIQTTTAASGSTSGLPWDFDWWFTNPVGIGGAAPAGDLYGTLKIDFTRIGGFDSDEVFQFGVDTDLVVPEPTTIVLLSLGLLGMAGLARRQEQ